MTYYKIKSKETPKAILVFIPGDGAACYKSDYHNIGDKVIKENIYCYFLDTISIGISSNKSDISSSEINLLKEITELLQSIKNEYLHIPIFLAGHSSGARIVINYAVSHKRLECDGYILVSPYLGDHVKKNQIIIDKEIIQKVKTPSFVFNFLTNGMLCGNIPSVINNNSKKNSNDSLIITSIKNFSKKQIGIWNSAPLFSRIKKPIGLFIGSEDELFDPIKVVLYDKYLNDKIKMDSTIEIIQGLKHLTILDEIDCYIIKFIEKLRLTTASTG